ncbi:MAG: hypothetical protein SF052_20310 [Bacteroidia bacterium]|nr:hypothetical protein [Bacteroidia bacterium]
MKILTLITLTILLPVAVWAHDIPVPHDHVGIWSSWEIILLIVAAGLGAFFYVKKANTKKIDR